MPEPQRPALTVGMPALDEEVSLERVVRATANDLDRARIPFEIIIVDDGSTDATSRIADALAAEMPFVRVIHHDRRRGVGAGWRSCVAASRGEWVFLQPADGQIDPSTPRRFFAERPERGVVVGTREPFEKPAHRRILSAAYHRLVGMALGLRLGDHGPCFLFRSDAVRRLRVISGDRSPTVLVEWVYLFRRDGADVKEFPVGVLPRIGGRTKAGRPADVAATLIDIMRLAVAYRILSRAASAGAEVT